MKKTRLCAVIWQQCNALCWAPRLFAIAISLSLSDSSSVCLSLSPSASPCGSLLYLICLFCLIERRHVPVSQNKDAKQRQIELLLGMLLVTTAAL